MNKTRTSCSDNGLYPAFCLKAAKDENTFSTFRSNETYKSIVETLKSSWGQQYLDIIVKNTPEFIDSLRFFETTDHVGGPELSSYKIGRWPWSKSYNFSPTTMRYIKVLSDLKLSFKDLTNFNIVEIGGGYGGQCKIINDAYKINKYIIYDLPEVLELIERYLNEFNITNYELRTIQTLPKVEKYDLVISNYAFTELNAVLQQKYFKHILTNSNNGYLTCNFNTHTFEDEQYTKDKLISELIQANKIVTNEEDSLLLPKIDLDCNIDLLTFKTN